jgi:hypothetical protein
MTPQPASAKPRLTRGQRLMLGLVLAPGAAVMALAALVDLTAAPELGRDTLEILVTAIYVVFVGWIAGWTAWMAVTGRDPGGPR